MKERIKKLLQDKSYKYINDKINSYIWGLHFISKYQPYSMVEIVMYDIKNKYVITGTCGIDVANTSYADMLKQIEDGINSNEDKVFLSLYTKEPINFPNINDNKVIDIVEMHKSILKDNGIDVWGI